MRISVDVNGYYDWQPAPPGTQITEDDVKALRVKDMLNGGWHVRVPVKCETLSHHDVSIHEEQVCRRIAALEKTGKTASRESVVVEELQSSFRHHLHRNHMEKINVHDDGPSEELMRAALAEFEVPPERWDEVLTHYLDDADFESYLNVVFKTKAAKAARGGKEKK
jgi:hypothetical protein